MSDSQNTAQPVDVNAWGQRLFENKQAQQPYPRVTDAHSQIDMESAYAIQSRMVELCLSRGSQSIGGFKAALTAKPAQQAMGIDEPVVGVLFAAGHHSATPNEAYEISLASIPKLVLETELGFTLNESVSSPISNIAQLQSITASFAPTIELASLGFGDTSPTGIDLVSSNSASNSYLTGTPKPWAANSDQDLLDSLQVSLQRNQQSIHSTSSGSLLDGQWHALLWLVNSCIALGYKIEPHHLLMTGSIGGIHPAERGHYVADYQQAGQLQLSVT